MISELNPPSNFIGGDWTRSRSTVSTVVANPATGEVLARVALANDEDVNAAVEAAKSAFPAWRRTPPQERIQHLFRFKQLLQEHADEIARLTTAENGKTLAEARAELQRGIENVEVACGIPSMMQGYNLEDVAGGIDEIMIRQPLGVTAAITPFNFPSMIPLWFLPYAIACGNTFILKPSERVPLTAHRLIELLHQTGVPKGVVNLVVGAKPAVDALLRHPDVRAVSFVGSTPVARYVYAEASAHGKRVQCQGGAKNHVVVMPDADLETTAKIVSDSAFGCAGQRCLAVSTAVVVSDVSKKFCDMFVDLASSIRVGNGLDEGVQMGPVITPESKKRILDMYKPAGPGPFPAVLFNHGSGKDYSREFEALGPVFAHRGWAFFAPCRRGQGLSASAGAYIVEQMNEAQKAHGRAARFETMVRLLRTDHLNDQLAALAWLKKSGFVDPRRIAVAGNSFGGIQTLLGAESGSYCAAIASAAAAQTWSAPDVQSLMTKAVGNAQAPIFFFQAENDWDLTPSRSLAATAESAGKRYRLKIYPPFGNTKEEGHSFGYFGSSIWADDVLQFMNEHCRK